MADLFYALIFIPLYNALIVLVELIPGYDVGIAVILLTILIKFLLFPLSIKAVRTQLLMREIEEPMKQIREKFKDRQKQAEAMMALYREKGVNPFSSILVLLIQLPIIFGLYWVFYKGGLPEIRADLLYGFVPVPATVNMEFLGLIDMAGKSLILALLAGISQFFQAKLSLPPLSPAKEGEGFRGEFARSMHLNMKYVLPVVVGVISYTISSAVALYWLTSNLFTIGQELYVRRHVRPALTDQKFDKSSFVEKNAGEV